MLYFTLVLLRIAVYLCTKLIYDVECVSRKKTLFFCLVVNDVQIQNSVMIDTAHEQKRLIVLLEFNVQFVDNLTYLYS